MVRSTLTRCQIRSLAKLMNTGQSYKANFGIKYIKKGFNKLNFTLNYINFAVIYAKKVLLDWPQDLNLTEAKKTCLLAVNSKGTSKVRQKSLQQCLGPSPETRAPKVKNQSAEIPFSPIFIRQGLFSALVKGRFGALVSALWASSVKKLMAKRKYR